MNKLILLHGALGSKAELDALKAFLDKTYDVHTLSFSGHGGVAFEKEFSIAQFSKDLYDYLEKNEIENTALFGYSMGGYVALSFAQKHPKRVSKIITLGTKFYWTEEIAAKEIAKLNPSFISDNFPKYAGYQAALHMPNDWKIVFKKTAKMMLEMGLENPLQSSNYLTLFTPTLCIIGDKDEMITIEETVDVYRSLPNGSLMILPNTKHAINKVDSELLASQIIRFIDVD